MTYENDVFDEMIETEDKKEKTSLDVLENLFSTKNLETKTELTTKQISVVNSKRMISKMLCWERLGEALDYYMLLMISKDRKGRLEFVEAFKSEREKETGQNKSGWLGDLKSKIGLG